MNAFWSASASGEPAAGRAARLLEGGEPCERTRSEPKVISTSSNIWATSRIAGTLAEKVITLRRLKTFKESAPGERACAQTLMSNTWISAALVVSGRVGAARVSLPTSNRSSMRRSPSRLRR